MTYSCKHRWHQLHLTPPPTHFPLLLPFPLCFPVCFSNNPLFRTDKHCMTCRRPCTQRSHGKHHTGRVQVTSLMWLIAPPLTTFPCGDMSQSTLKRHVINLIYLLKREFTHMGKLGMAIVTGCALALAMHIQGVTIWNIVIYWAIFCNIHETLWKINPIGN